MKAARSAILVQFLRTIVVVVTASLGATAACGDEDTSSVFGTTAADAGDASEGGASNASSSGGFNPCPPDSAGKSAAAPVVHLCSDAGAPDATDGDAATSGECEDDLAACKRICEILLEGYDYCGVDDGTDGGRVVRCTIAAKQCGG